MMLIHGDCIEVMKQLDANSVDSIVTDPPYELKFMGKNWDNTGISNSVEMWTEAMRVLKPGGFLLAFGGTRTQHRMVCAIEDAGFEIRDSVMWIYGSGFPKSLNVSKAIDKAAGAEREVIEKVRVKGGGMEHVNRSNAEQHKYRPDGYQKGENVLDITAPTTDAAKQWEGWGTALKPAHEPICMARKPLIGTVAANVLQFGTGALNIDGCRVPLDGDYKCKANGRPSQTGLDDHYNPDLANLPDTVGRWPANIITDGSVEFPSTTSKGHAPSYDGGQGNLFKAQAGTGGMGERVGMTERHFDTGTAARFFYCAKASRKDRNEGCENMDKKPLHWSSGDQNPGSFQSEGTDKTSQNNHPTVKPTALMQYLCRLVTPPGGTVLDPFCGSGSTGKAAAIEGFEFIGIDINAEYIAIAHERARPHQTM